jgi:3-oxosteroid 1-dehydrogenase
VVEIGKTSTCSQPEKGEDIMDRNWDYTTDVVIVGSGGGGMTAALVAKDRGADVVICEKGDRYGGSTAMSGGGIWAPNNHLMRKAGLNDSEEEALVYLRHITAGEVSEERLRAYIDAVPLMVKYLETHSHMRFMIIPGYGDYYPDVEGAKPHGGRSIETVPLNAKKLGKALGQMRESPIMPRIHVTNREVRRMIDSSLWGRMQAARILLSYFLNPARRFAKSDPRLTAGGALIGRLYLSLAERGVPVWMSTRACRLVVEDGRVTGLEVDRAGNTIAIRAKKGVVLAAGGFSHNKKMREQYQRQPISDAWTVSCPENTGDTIQMGLEVGAALDLMDEAWWASSSLIPGWNVPLLMIIEKSLPGSIIVNAKGKRLTNEAGPYSDLVKDQYSNHFKNGNAIPAYLIVDQRFRNKYPVGPMMPRTNPQKYINRGYIRVSDTLNALAEQCSIDPRGLVDEINRFNQYAVAGKDPDFGRGEKTIDRYYGDPSVKPNPCLAPLDTPPYYAIQVWPGDIGTKGGLKTNCHARVLRDDGSLIDGLYATGNCTASVMGRSYAGPGATIGPTMAFGYVAALHATEH